MGQRAVRYGQEGRVGSKIECGVLQVYIHLNDHDARAVTTGVMDKDLTMFSV